MLNYLLKSSPKGYLSYTMKLGNYLSFILAPLDSVENSTQVST